MFDRILIANRAEIALRVIRTCRELGVSTVAVHSEVDRESLHVRMADAAVSLGEGSNAETYLNIEKILDAAETQGAQAVHPGYGFLSEKHEFAAAVEKRGLTWIGPPAKAIEAMGSKAQAREIAAKHDVPLTPGSPPLKDAKDALRHAKKIGFPVLLKASYGGGGMGMVVAEKEDEVPKAFDKAAKQAEAAFGSGELILEKFILQPRHIEVQVLADADGTVHHLGERECSIQRRYQKLLEEAPSPALNAKKREEVARAAVAAAEAVGYVNAGTCEFIYSDGKFYFNEMNTRLQVEHPVTEMVYGVDLVAEQLRIAAGEDISFDPAELEPRGWSIECRVNAEDPYQNFAPSPGLVDRYQAPSGPGVRVDSHLYAGYEIPSAYDSLVGKVIAWAPTREQCARRLRRALGEYDLGSVTTNIPFHVEVLGNARFLEGDLSTRFIEDERILERLLENKDRQARQGTLRVVAALAAVEAEVGLARFARSAVIPPAPGAQRSGWGRAARREHFGGGLY